MVAEVGLPAQCDGSRTDGWLELPIAAMLERHMVDIRQIGDFKLRWGESLHWDDRAGRLYFVDCAANRLRWLDAGGDKPAELRLASMPTGLALTESGHVLALLDDGAHLVDADSGRTERFAGNPAPAPEPRLNDAQADRHGNLITGSLSFTHDNSGSFWWLSPRGEWRRLDGGVSDANGPVVTADGGTLLIADTSAKAIYRYAYDAQAGAVGPRERYADTLDLGGLPDGAALDADGNYWSTITGGSKLVCFGPEGDTVREVGLPVEYPTSVAFGGTDLDRLYVTSIGMDFRHIRPTMPASGALLEITGLGATGAIEPRFSA